MHFCYAFKGIEILFFGQKISLTIKFDHYYFNHQDKIKHQICKMQIK